MLFRSVDDKIYRQTTTAPKREQLLLQFIDYMKIQHEKGVPIRAMTRHILGLYHGQPNAKRFRQLLSGAMVELKHLYRWLDLMAADSTNDRQ